MQKSGGQLAIGTALQVEHVVYVLTGIAIYKEPRTGRTPLLALGIAREPLA